MPKKKKVEVPVEPVESVESEIPPLKIVEVEVPEAVQPAEPMVSVVARGSFHDGAFKADFAKYGYDVHWNDLEVREIPARLYVKLMRRSGGKFALKGDR